MLIFCKEILNSRWNLSYILYNARNCARQIKIFRVYKDFTLHCTPALHEIDDVWYSRDRKQGLNALMGWQECRKGTENAEVENVVTDFLDFSITHVSGRQKRCAKGWKKYVLHFRWRDGNWRSYARETGPQIIYYSIVSRELPRIATRCDATEWSETRRDVVLV